MEGDIKKKIKDEDVEPRGERITEGKEEDGSNVGGGRGGKEEGSASITFEELLDVAGTNGRWKTLLFVFCAMSGFTTPMNVISYQFLGATPEHWCHVEPLVDANWTDHQIISLAIPSSNTSTKPEGCLMYDYNYTAAAEMGYRETLRNMDVIKKANETKVISCLSRDFNITEDASTVVTEWDLVCERRALYSTTSAVNQAGMLIGNAAYGYIIDAIGRRRTVIWSSCLTIIVSLLTAASPTIGVYIFMRGLIQVVDSGFYMACFILAMEMSSVRQRTHLGALFLIPWAFGYMLVPGIAILVKQWQWLQVAFTLPSFLLVAYFWVMPESPRWLILHGEYAEALKVFKWAARVNKKTLPSDEYLLETMKNIEFEESHLIQVQEKKTAKNLLSQALEVVKEFLIVLVIPGMQARVYIVFFLWMASAGVYYGVGLNATNISADPYMYLFLGGVMEVFAYLFLWMSLVYMGRRNTLFLLFLVCGVSIAVVAVLMISYPEAPVGVRVALALCGKMASTATFQLVWVFTLELFPTKYRPMIIGEAGICARIGSASSPYINDILGSVVAWAPSAVFSILSLIATILVAFLPETRDKDLPETNKFT